MEVSTWVHILWHLYHSQKSNTEQTYSTHPFLSFKNKPDMHDEFNNWINQSEWSRPESSELMDHLRQNGVRIFYSEYENSIPGYLGYRGLIGMSYLQHVIMQKPANQLNFLFTDDA
jgi:hypothetical protein